jgi:hypothetical protein
MCVGGSSSSRLRRSVVDPGDDATRPRPVGGGGYDSLLQGRNVHGGIKIHTTGRL